MLPTHHGDAKSKRTPSSSGTSNQTSERQLLLIVFAAFCIVCFGAIFYMPEMGGGSHPERPFKEVLTGFGHADVSAKQESIPYPPPHHPGMPAAPPAPHMRATTTTTTTVPPIPRQPKPHVQVQHEEEAWDQHPNVHAPPAPAPAPAPTPQKMSHATAQSRERGEFVKSMMRTAFKGYSDFAWGHNELMPKARRGHSAGIFGRSRMGATIVDAIDTLYIMGLMDEYTKARAWIATSLNFDVSAGVSVFEICIRFVGGLLSIYGLTKDEIYKNLAVDITDRLLPAFNTPTGIPKAMINLRTGASHNWGWASGGASILSEFGTMQLEFEYLSVITGDPKYRNAVQKVTKLITSKPRPPDMDGLYPNYVDPNTGNWGSRDISLGALGDSFYEYLLKMWIFRGGRNSGDTTDRAPYDDAMAAVKRHLVHRASNGMLYVAEQKGQRLMHKMGHLACFTGGMFALGAKHAPTPELEKWYMETGAGITETCYQGYHMTATHIGPEMMTFTGNRPGKTMSSRDAYYILRPEVVESYFVMWRMTHEQKWRDYAWEAVEAIEKHCRCGVGYCGLKNVDQVPAQQDDVQQSFFLAEALKYLYLIFQEDDVISLD
eukprot:UC1_evm1s1833